MDRDPDYSFESTSLVGEEEIEIEACIWDKDSTKVSNMETSLNEIVEGKEEEEEYIKLPQKLQQQQALPPFQSTTALDECIILSEKQIAKQESLF